MSSTNSDDFGANQGFIEDLYAAYLQNKDGVGPQWAEMFRSWEQQGRKPANGSPASPDPQPKKEVTPAQRAVHSQADRASTPTTNVTRSDLPPQPRAAAAPAITPYAKSYSLRPASAEEDMDPKAKTVTALKGGDRGLAKNMDASLSIPTATSLRAIPARVMFDNRTVINRYLASTRGGKISFTHLIAYAMVEALAEMPEMNVSYSTEGGKPSLVEPKHVNLGIAIDVVKPDGTRTLVVPSIKAAETKTFSEFVSGYEELVDRGRNNKLTIEDYQGTTATLTNPGGIGTTESVPRLMVGQGLIVGVGSMTYPPEFQGTADETIARLGVSKVVHIGSTYDHRVIQGATSGRFLRLMENKLLGQDGFYERVYLSLRVPYTPVVWEKDVEYDAERELGKPARIAELIHAYRSRGHLIADTDPLSFHLRRHPDLEIGSYGLSLWDLDRSFPTGGFAGTSHLTLRQILTNLREAYCRTVGIEYMHIQDPVQRKWFQERLERAPEATTPEQRVRILEKLNQAEAFEVFLQTKYVGQKRFSLEGGESLIPALDSILGGAADDGLQAVAIGMAHRGRLNVLTNIAGKSFGQVFSEFDGVMDPTKPGSGDVKYHLGTEGTYTSAQGDQVGVYLAANPSHLEAADGVLEGVVRGMQDQLDDDGAAVVPLLIHGDAAFSGQGVVTEVLNLSQLPAYRTGGTIHIIVNNQIGFTTAPSNSRSSRYTTDITKGLQLPIFHVNGDDPEAVCRMARMAYEYRMEFKKDVILDIICYRKRGHNEGDDPSMTQPIMYSLVNEKRTTRQLYQEALLGRGDISEEQAAQVEQGFHNLLDKAFQDAREAEKRAEANEAEAADSLGMPASQQEDAGTMVGWSTAVSAEVLRRIGQAHTTPPEGFTPHKKIMSLFEKRNKMAHEGHIDWGFGELLAFGSLLIEGVPVRMSGQDCRRGTFTQRHAVAHDLVTGEEWTPLMSLTEDQARFKIYDSALSEYSVMAFEYGYSVQRPDALVLWEAQFGDFANGAQTVVDEFISSAEQKWHQAASIVLLLPHGYEGQGPDHSSARIERYLQLCAEENMIVVQPSTPANYFHMLREQAYRRPRKPMIVFSPKQLLRRKGADSMVEDFTSGTVRKVIGESHQLADVDRVLLCTGRIYYDLLEERTKKGDDRTAIIRIEQLYPNPVEEVRAELDKYPNAEVFWVQDEPANQGAWAHFALGMFPELGRAVTRISRPAAASTAAGMIGRHRMEGEELMRKAFAR
ncbi:MAG: multifunctional oxoglutarate decarboxylase/oxoglutarate dehydrogenase thiamine pyrophosphate-binding subunit/dihydrolipoyllysine-residue succinyltransferase subunit [Trueperella sp.]|uniref:multifunctional oxoglutarate decarboxylase/oxoglutarate dehydrogenase thiamine pyrophosphate-binding subunit/dihydrolipoyllysine-residue succinyltransferase subunit n=1 Tax=Trueperella sp. TaxID=2699835 RepID=UPI0025CE39EE|nr:multifunctional oxoglutarate decarboxylase/oxoglutarate dehydrogenase thiamine pyrophosphate-binding subunit/dihydrolipoyllysine-residue succinyltransferase subunit [Trueperella sp.]MCI7304795.1 multifunctional oxoglutarate decarboxylase/oxoglutarate dehydrogenase thiamine pyrophosphate-binding subunit/dihydrolipoyllysine-residue succinyltransferase subunit [Trueperella sp.]